MRHGNRLILMIQITDDIIIDERELHWDFVRSSGPGGQNVNKVSTAVILRFNAAQSPALTPGIRDRLGRIAGRRMTSDGVLVIKAARFRSQSQNRDDALDRLRDLIQRAAVPPKKRRKTRPTRASVEKRLSTKQHRSRIKRQRGKVDH